LTAVSATQRVLQKTFGFFRGTAIQGSQGYSGLVNYPMNLAGRWLKPGDLILGDDDGLVIVAIDEVRTVLEKSLKRDAMETDKAKVLAGGVSRWNSTTGRKICSLGLKEE